MKRVFGQHHIGLALGALICVPFSATLLTGCGGGGSGHSVGNNLFKGNYGGTYRVLTGAQAGLTGAVNFKVDGDGKVIGTLADFPNTVPGKNTVGTVKSSTGAITFKITDAQGHPGGAGTAVGTLQMADGRRNGRGTFTMPDGSTGDFVIGLIIKGNTGGTTAGGTTSGSTTSGGTTSGTTTSGTTTSGGTTSGSTTSGGTTSGTTTSGGTTSGTTTSGGTTSGSTTSGNTTSGTTTSGSTTSGTTTSGGTTSGTTSGNTTSGGTTSGSTTAGNTTSGSTTAGNTTTGSTTAGNTTTGATTAGNTTSGSTTAGGTTSGSTTVGNVTSGSTTAGNTTSGSTTAGGTTSGSTTVGNVTSGSTTAGNTTSGSTTAGNTTSGSTTVGGVTSGGTTSGTTNPTFLPGTYQVKIQTTNPSSTVVATIPVNSVGTGTANLVNGILGSVKLSLKVNADGSAKLTIPGTLLGAATTANVQLAVQPDGHTILGAGALVGPIKGTVTLTRVS